VESVMSSAMNFSTSDISTLQAIIADAAEIEIMPRFRKIDPSDFREKSSTIDLVTDADEQAEWRIRDAVAKAFPQALFVGEESVARDAKLLDKIGDADLAVIIDPVDGTSNFAWGVPAFGVLCAVTRKGETIAGLIYDPVLKEWFVAEKGSGAHAIAPDRSSRKLQVKAPAPLSDMIGISSWYLMPEPERSLAAARVAKTKATFAYRCAAYEYRLVCEGHCHFVHYWKLMPWDHAAGLLIHAEAGGYSACFDGMPYRATTHKGGVIAAPDRASWELLHAALVGR
jgi:fructose-1,6-bisphosphatase/inositol monophosphatase family enzyme